MEARKKDNQLKTYDIILMAQRYYWESMTKLPGESVRKTYQVQATDREDATNQIMDLKTKLIAKYSQDIYKPNVSLVSISEIIETSARTLEGQLALKLWPDQK